MSQPFGETHICLAVCPRLIMLCSFAALQHALVPPKWPFCVVTLYT